MIDISSYFGSLALMASLVTIISGYLNTHVSFLKSANGTFKQLVSWVVAILIAFIGQSKAIGVVADSNTVWTILTGISVGLIANGMFDVTLVQSVLSFLKAHKGAGSNTPTNG